MFENLSDRLQDVVHKIKGYGKITEDNIERNLTYKDIAIISRKRKATPIGVALEFFP